MTEENIVSVEQNFAELEMQLRTIPRNGSKKNYELLEYKDFKESVKTVPDGVDVQELLEFKRSVEQNKLESEGKYTEARQALEQQFREAAEAKDKRIAELEARVRELELIAPANTALA